MKQKRQPIQEARGSKVPRRLSVTIPPAHHVALARIAVQKKVSLAWVVRDALETYLSAERTSVGLKG